MITISDDVLDRWMREDAPSLDLTTSTLGLRDEAGVMRFTTRDSIHVCGTEEVRRILARLGADVVSAVPSGASLAAGEIILECRGGAASLHLAWKVSLNILEHASGIATRTRRLIDAARSAQPGIEVVATRKGFPGTKELAIKAIVAGGALPHRLGLSETILAFEQHRVFCGGFDGFVARIPTWMARVPEKKVIVEITTLAEARTVAQAGVDGVQFDKIAPEQLQPWVAELRRDFPRLLLIAAGGVNESNAAAYAATGVQVLATSSIFHGPPADIAARITLET